MVFAESGEAIFCGFQRGGDDAAPDLFRYEEWRGVLGGTGASRRSAGFVSLSRMQMYPCAVGLPADTQIVRFSLPVCYNVVGGASPRRMEKRPHAVPGEHSPCAHPVHFSPPTTATPPGSFYQTARAFAAAPPTSLRRAKCRRAHMPCRGDILPALIPCISHRPPTAMPPDLFRRAEWKCIFALCRGEFFPSVSSRISHCHATGFISLCGHALGL